MAYNDLPQIDSSSENDDTAKRALAGIFNQSTGFIPREQIPDKGCDFMVELIQGGKGATNFNFALQLKSIESPSFINNNLLSYSFKTSRLGYMLNNIPAYGILVLLDISTGVLYYDYVDEIYSRLMDERSNDDWKKNDAVNVHIPVSNVLDEQSVLDIHKTFLNRFLQAKLMQNEYGRQYELPTLRLATDSNFDPKNIDDVKGALKSFGISSLFLNDLDIIFSLIVSLPVKEILTDKDLVIMASLAYAESGKIADALFYIERLRKRFTLTNEENQMILFMELRLRLNLGTIDAQEFIDNTKKLLADISDIDNQITLRLNILFYELLKVKGLETMPLEFGEIIQKLADDIDSLPDSVQKYQFKVWNADNLALWISHFRGEGFNELSVHESLDQIMPMEERIEKARRITKVHSLFYLCLSEVDKYAKEHNDRLLQAYAINSLVKFQISFEIQQISYGKSLVTGNEDQRNHILHKINLAATAFNVFLEYNLYSQAHSILCYQLELIYLSRHRYNFQDDFEFDKLHEIKKSMENELEIDSHELAIPNLLNKITSDENQDRSMRYVVGLNDDQMGNFALLTFQSGKFPFAKLENIIHELRSYKMFYERCTDPNIELLPSNNTSRAYSSPVLFMMKNSLTGISSLMEKDMDRLLKSWGF